MDNQFFHRILNNDIRQISVYFVINRLAQILFRNILMNHVKIITNLFFCYMLVYKTFKLLHIVRMINRIT